MRSPLTDWREVQADAELLVLNADGRAAAGALRDRNREFAAGQEAGFFAAFGDQVRFGKALEEPLRLHGALIATPRSYFVVEQEQVQEVAERELAGRRRDVAAEVEASTRSS